MSDVRFWESLFQKLGAFNGCFREFPENGMSQLQPIGGQVG